MSAHLSERVKIMKEGFMTLHNNGKTINEIAEHFKVSTWSVYNNLQDIADANGVTRDSLLTRVNKSHDVTKRTLRPQEKITPIELNESFFKMLHEVDQLIENIDEILEDEEDI